MFIDSHSILEQSLRNCHLLSFGEGWKNIHIWEKKKWKSLCCIPLFAAPWTVAYQVSLSMDFFNHEYWSGLSFPAPEDLLNPGIEPRSPALQADSLMFQLPGKPQLPGRAIEILHLFSLRTCMRLNFLHVLQNNLMQIECENGYENKSVFIKPKIKELCKNVK